MTTRNEIGSALLRRLGNAEVPVAGTWKVDAGHAEVGFWGRHFMLTKVRGRFTGVDATVVIADDPAASTVEATIDMTSVVSGDHTRDDHLRSADFFDVVNWPQARFRSSRVTWESDQGTMTGDLTIRNVTHPLTLEIEFVGGIRDPWDQDRSVFSATGTINREDWDLTWNMALEAGGLLVSNEVHLELHVELIRQG
ncbi:MAG: YceI family protein [Acidimicrobiia bacterium]